VFPSILPSGRHEAVVSTNLAQRALCVGVASVTCRPMSRCAQLLTELLDKLMLRMRGAREAGKLGPRDLIRQSQKIHSTCMFEIVRQVSVHCIERGVLLKRVWE
jgi:hypothetical protein